MGSDPSYPDAEEHVISLPFKGMMNTRRGVDPQGYMHLAHATLYSDGYLVPYPGADQTETLVIEAAPWASNEPIIGWVPTISKGDFVALTDEQVWSPDTGVAGELVSKLHSSSPAGTIACSTGSTTVSGTNTEFKQEIAPGNRMYIYSSGDYIGEVQTVASDTSITLTANAAVTDSGVTYRPWFRQFQYTPLWRGPRWTHHAGRIVLVGKYGIYASESYGDVYFRLLTNHSAVDVITFAGRPVLIGAKAYTGSKNQGHVPATTNLLAWPMRTDNTNWTGYGSGELELLDDGANCHAGAMWGREAFIFTASGIYQLQQTGMGAGNPIAAIRVSVNNYYPPLSNVVTGRKGMYYMSIRGPVMFDGRQVVPIYKFKSWDLESPMEIPIAYGWYNPFWESIHFHNPSGSSGTKWVIHEDPLGLTEGHSSSARACNYHITGAYWHLNEPYLASATILATGAAFAKRVAAASEYVSYADDTLWGSVHWAGITGKEGPSINKVAKKIWITYEGGIVDGPDLNYEIVPDKATIAWGSLAGSATLTVSDTMQTIALDPAGVNCLKEVPAWSVALEIPARTKIYQVRIEYAIGGHV